MESIYEAADFFLARTAILPYQNQEISPEELFTFFQNSPLFQEAIAIASSSLYQSLMDKEADKNKLFSSLLKYYLRMNSRTTPFGLFSFVGWGEFREQSNLDFSYSNLDKKVHPDGEWSKIILDDLYRDISSIRPLKVMTNPNLVKKCGRVHLKAENEKTASLDSISIRSSMVSDFIFSLAKTPLLFKDLETKLLAKFDEHPKEVVLGYLKQIFQKGYLISECTFSLRKPLPLLDLNLAHEFQAYQNAEFGKGTLQLQTLLEKINPKKQIKHPLQVNTYRKEGIFHLATSLKEQIEETISLLCSLTSEEFKPYHDYQKEFQEKYGTHRLVPLLELLDPHRGLGIPSITPKERKKDNFLKMTGDKVIHLEKLPPFTKEQQEKAPLSFELFFELLEDNTLLVNPTSCSNQAGATFGRFSYLFDDNQKEQLREFLKKEENLLPENHFVEATFLPDSPRLVNVAYHEKLRSYQLELHYHEKSHEILELEDIYVGARENYLYFYSQKWKKELYITLSSSINPALAPQALQFLLFISRSRFNTFSSFIWGESNQEPFLPRVCYKNVILSPARWLIKMSDFSEKELKEYFTSHDIPHKVFLTEFDHRLALNWTYKDQFKLLSQHLQTKKELTLYEVIATEEGKHVTEFVVPCVKRNSNRPHISYFYPPCLQVYSLDRIRHPGTDWLYIKFYLAEECQDHFLKTYLSPFIQTCQIDKWFYVRYKDPQPHLRVRLHGSIELSTLYKQAAKWITEGILANYSLHPYEKEIERYGGPEGIDVAEAIFHADSENCIQLMNKSFDLPRHFLASLGIINYVQAFYPNLEDQIQFFTPYLQKMNLLNGVREHTSKALQLASELFSLDLFLQTRSHSETLAKIMIHSQWNTKESVLQSLLHMHCNRLLGLDRELEGKAHIIAYHLLQKRYVLKKLWQTMA